MSKSRILVAVLLVGILCAVGQAQEKVRIVSKLPAGTSWTFSETQEMSMDSTVKMAGQQQQMQQKMSRKMSGSAEVLQADATGRATAIKFTFDRDSGGSMEQMGQQMPMPFPLAGQTVTVRKDNGVISHDYRGQLDPQTDLELKNMLDADEAFLPTEPVGVGDRWSPDLRKMAEKWGMDPTSSKIGVDISLKELGQQEGRRVAVVEVSADVAGAVQGMNGTRRINGRAVVDLETGHTITSELGGTFDMSGLQQQQAPNGDILVMDIASRGTMKMQSKATLKGGGAAPMPGPGPVVNPNPQPVFPPVNNNAAPLSGTYKSDKLTLKFGATGVDILFGAQQFAGTVTRWDGRSFAGKFRTPDGGEFDFTGTVSGNDMTFSTGGTDYQLKADTAPRNPLSP